MLAQAWHTAAFGGAVQVGKLPPLGELLGDGAAQKATVGQRVAAALRSMGVAEE